MKAASLAIALASLLATSGALADSKQCVEAAERGQRLRDDRKLMDAREQFVACSRPECPAIVMHDCVGWAERSNTEIPKLVPRAKGEDGQDLVNVRLYVDGKVYAEKLDGRRIPMDPGAHVVRFEGQGLEPHEENVVLTEADVRMLTVTLRAQKAVPAATAPALAPATTAPPAEGSGRRGPPVASYVLGAVSLVGFASFGYFAATGSSDESGLSDGCSKTKTCAQSAVDDVRTKYLVADISLGVGVVALGSAIAVWVLRPSPTTSASLRVVPAASGAMVTGTF